ncbi:hypothetical protein CBR_g50376 [Chara braunii]|uniref:Integrase catalytic domain-containing protein n=1 Tax=Chara braunii TaxID=69332 RepID=A0A388M6R4_CHABU|nr:hypothetical protein CBR_g50376 [Chara braunii]|eukprot:GBG90195.1 hypothetical protein CBR_g50376 [Chara braunii]
MSSIKTRAQTAKREEREREGVLFESVRKGKRSVRPNVRRERTPLESSTDAPSSSMAVITSAQWQAMLDAADESQKPFFQKLYDDAVQKEREAAAAARAADIADQVALLRIPEANADRFQEELAAAVAALVRLRTSENLESRMTALEQRNEELQAKVISLEQSQLSASRPPNPRSAIIPTSQANTALVPRASGTVASAGTGASSSSGSTGSSALVMVPNAGTSAQNAAVPTGVQYSGPMVDKRAATLPSKYDGKADITSWISSMRSYFEVMRTPQEDRSMIMGTNTEPALRNHIELQAVAAGYECIDLTDWLKVTPARALEDLLLDRYRDKHAALKARLKLEALKGQTWRSSMQALEQHLTGLFNNPDLGMTDVSCMDVVMGVAPKEYLSLLALKDHATWRELMKDLVDLEAKDLAKRKKAPAAGLLSSSGKQARGVEESSALSTTRDAEQSIAGPSEEPGSGQQPALEARTDADSKAGAVQVLYTEPWEESREVDLHAHMEHWLQLKQQRRVQGSVELTFFKLLINRRYIRVLIDSGSTTNFFSPNGIRKAGLGMKQVELQNPCRTQVGNQEVVTSTHAVKSVRITFDKDRTVTHELNFYVLDKCPLDAVIGLGWLKAHCLRTTWADNQFVVLDAKGNERTVLLDETRESPVTLLSANKFCRKLKEDLIEHTAKDPNLSPILEQLKVDPNSQPDFHECEGLAFRRYGKFDRLCVPNHAPLRTHFLDLAHGRNGHFGFEKTYESLLQQFGWPGMKGSAQKFIVECQVCQRIKVHRHKPYGLLRPLPIPDGPGESISIDFADMGKVSEAGNSQVMVIVDRFSKFLNLIPLPPHAPTELVIEEFHQQYILQSGVPKTIVSDRDTRFISKDWKDFTSQIYDIKLNRTSGRHPEANGLAEEINQTVIQLLRALIVPYQNTWDKELHKVKGLYNNSIHSATRVTPNQLQYVWPMRNRLSYLFPERSPGLMPGMPGYNAKYARLLKAVTAAMNKRQHPMIKHANKLRKEEKFKVGDYIWVKMSEFSNEEGISRKLLPLCYGPWQILKVVGDDFGPSFVIDVPPHLRTYPVFHASKLFPHIDDETFPFRDPMIPRPIDGGHEIDKIVSHEGRGRNRPYKVHFLYHPLTEFFWIDWKELLKSAPRVVNAYERQITEGQTAKFVATMTSHGLTKSLFLMYFYDAFCTDSD